MCPPPVLRVKRVDVSKNALIIVLAKKSQHRRCKKPAPGAEMTHRRRGRKLLKILVCFQELLLPQLLRHARTDAVTPIVMSNAVASTHDFFHHVVVNERGLIREKERGLDVMLVEEIEQG